MTVGCNMYKESKWASDLMRLQGQDGSWGNFHSLSDPKRQGATTEQALRRLSILGYTIEDEPIQRAVHYMHACLSGQRHIPDRREKSHDWDVFTELMLATWIRKFTKEDMYANEVADKWAQIISMSFSGGVYDHQAYVAAYKNTIGATPRGERLIDFVSFYPVSLVADKLDEKTEALAFDHVLNHKNGLYYIYGNPAGNTPLSALPDCFCSKASSRYLGAIELLSAYRRNLKKLRFVADWIGLHQNEFGSYDMGSAVADKLYFPLSNSWRQKANREKDCTYRIKQLLDSLQTEDRREDR